MVKLKNGTFILYICSFTALFFSIISLCVSAHRTSNLSFDYLGFLVGILSVLTTVLIGWDIYKHFSMEKVASDLKHAAPAAVCMSLAQLGMVLYNKGDYESAIQILLNAIALHYENYEINMDKEPIKYSIAKLKEIQKELQKDNKQFSCSKNDFAAFYLAAKNTENEDLIKFVESFHIQ